MATSQNKWAVATALMLIVDEQPLPLDWENFCQVSGCDPRAEYKSQATKYAIIKVLREAIFHEGPFWELR